uniref:Fe2OG dioxygenase domain-containing protein n=1 Tax=Salix viminalis TaxID=40686 RepID=A0A6N2NCJ8_SALVM
MSLLMDSTSSSLLLSPPPYHAKDETGSTLVFDSSFLQKQASLPSEFIWPHGDLVHSEDELKEPVIDLEGFLKGDEAATARAAELVRTACSNHGFFQVDTSLIRAAHEEIDKIFKLPLDRKLSVRRKPGDVSGYSGAHAHRYSSKMPWKETFSFGYHGDDHDSVPLSYCEAMKKVSLVIFELLAISLGVDRLNYRKFFEDGSSIMRCNYYPPCNNSALTLGTGGGLQVFADNKWLAIRPRPDALVVNIGDTFMALSNGRYRSCLHRAVVNRESERRSLVFFVSPNEEKVVRPPQDLVCREGQRTYPDFTWSDLLEFTQKHYRADVLRSRASFNGFYLQNHRTFSYLFRMLSMISLWFCGFFFLTLIKFLMKLRYRFESIRYFHVQSQSPCSESDGSSSRSSIVC